MAPGAFARGGGDVSPSNRTKPPSGGFVRRGGIETDRRMGLFPLPSGGRDYDIAI